MASPLAVGGMRQSGAPVRTQNGKMTEEKSAPKSLVMPDCL